MEPSNKKREGCLPLTAAFEQVLHLREIVRKESKIFHKVDVHLDEEGLVYRKPESYARLKSYKYYYHFHMLPFSGSK